MPLDVNTISAVTAELSQKLTGGRVEKIQQPEKDLILLTVRSDGTNYRMLIRAAGPNARVHLTEQSFENPASAPMFCMLLRKYLLASRLVSVTQPNGDRLINFSFESHTELGDRATLSLVVELMGRAANVILTDAEGRILDCLKRIPPSEYGTRALLPGLKYQLPPIPAGIPSGVSPNALMQEEESISAQLDSRYSILEKQELQRRRSQELVKSVRRTRDRQQRKLAAQTEELRQTERMEEVRREAELLQANLYRVRRGDRVLECENYYDEDSPIVRLALDPMKTPQQNLSARFKAYRKLRGAREHLTGLIEEGDRQLDYLNSVLEELDRARTEQDLREIRAELESSGLVRAERQRQSRRVKPAAPLRFESPDGMEILVGRNNAQNDELTTRLARRTDYWFHVQKQHGSHVILRCEGLEPSDAAICAAAELAARFSQARGSGHVAVDYTMVRRVRKPAGALPGKVIYFDARTIIVESTENSLEGESR